MPTTSPGPASASAASSSAAGPTGEPYKGICDPTRYISPILQELMPSQTAPPPCVSVAPLAPASPEPEDLAKTLKRWYPRESAVLQPAHLGMVIAEVDYRLAVSQEAGSSIAEAAILAAERVQDERIAKIIRDAKGNWKKDFGAHLLAVALSAIIVGPGAAALSTFAFAPLLRLAVRGAAGRSMGPKYARALSLLGDEAKIQALKPEAVRELATDLNDLVNNTAENLASAAADAAGQELRQERRSDDLTGTAGTDLLGEAFEFASRMRLLAARGRRGAIMAMMEDVGEGGVTRTQAEQHLQESWKDVLDVPELRLGARRRQLALAFEALVWSRSLPYLFVNIPARGAKAWPAVDPTSEQYNPNVPRAFYALELVTDLDSGLKEYLLDRFLEPAEEWLLRKRNGSHLPQGVDPNELSKYDRKEEYSREYLIVAYLRDVYQLTVEQITRRTDARTKSADVVGAPSGS